MASGGFSFLSFKNSLLSVKRLLLSVKRLLLSVKALLLSVKRYLLSFKIYFESCESLLLCFKRLLLCFKIYLLSFKKKRPAGWQKCLAVQINKGLNLPDALSGWPECLYRSKNRQRLSMDGHLSRKYLLKITMDSFLNPMVHLLKPQN